MTENEKCANEYLESGDQAVAARKTVSFWIDRAWHTGIVGERRGCAHFGMIAFNRATEVTALTVRPSVAYLGITRVFTDTLTL